VGHIHPRRKIQQEPRAKPGMFARFLEIAALMNARWSTSRGWPAMRVARPTGQGVLWDARGHADRVWLPAWRRRAKVKEVASPSSTSLIRACAGGADGCANRWRAASVASCWNLVLQRCVPRWPSATRRQRSLLANAFRQRGGFVWTRGNRAVGIEVKAAATWRIEHGSTLKA